MLSRKAAGSLRNRVVLGFLVFVFLAPASALRLKAQAGESDPLVGVWEGTLTGKPGTFQVYFSIEKKDRGGYTAKMDIPAQNARNIPVTAVVWNQPGLTLDLSSYGIVFEGRLADDRSDIEGSFKIGPENLSLSLKRSAGVPQMHRPQDPRPPYPYQALEVTFPNSAAAIDLSGTLTMPPGPGPFPAVVLVSGSGPQDRDSTLAGHRPFLVLADYLTRRGVAVLRFDDRGCGQSGGDFHAATTADFATDARAAWDFLRRQARIDGRRVGLLGHSEGALVAPMVAASAPEVAFIVLLAGTGVSGERLALRQIEDMARSRGAGEEAIRKEVRLYEGIIGVIRSLEDARAAEGEMKRVAREALAGMTEAERKELNESEISLGQDIQGYLADYPWNRFFLFYDPAPALRRVRCPVLALNGGKDTQVSAAINLPAIRRALEEGGNDDVEVEEIPGLNHLFQTAGTGHPREYGKIDETLAPIVLERIAGWILRQAGSTD
jgi:pimeloyl-ACP methyl ester carboxylesterase